MKRIIPLLMLALSTNVIADENWTSINDNDSFEFAAMNGSYLHSKGANSLVARSLEKANNSVTIFKWSVSDADCERHYGKLNSLDIKSGKFQYSTDFAFGGGSVGSKAAETICTVAEIMKATKPMASM